MEGSSVNNAYQTTLGSVTGIQLCKHCNFRARQKRKRELCNHCYETLTIRILYPSGKSLRRLGLLPDDKEPTEEELNSLIEEQRQHLPDWWDEEDRRQSQRYTSWGRWWEYDEE